LTAQMMFVQGGIGLTFWTEKKHQKICCRLGKKN
jgi:hypothetical protein